MSYPDQRSAEAHTGLAEARKAVLALRQRQQRSGHRDRITPAARDRRLPLSFAQQRLWFLDQWAPGQPVYNAPLVLRLRARLDVAALQRALTALVRRHEVLRTRYPAENGVPYQEVDPAPEAVPLPRTDFSTAATPEAAAADFVQSKVREPFDLSTGPVLRAFLARISDTEHVLVLVMHHIATDGWSTAILVRELIAGYRQATEGGAASPPLPVQFADYAVWQRGWLASGAADDQLAYWRDRLADLPTLDLPTDRPRPAQRTQAGATEEVLLPERLAGQLTEVGRRERVTPLAVALAVFQVLMSRYSGQDDVVLGSIFFGRTRPEIENLVGFFANTLVLRTSTAGHPTFRELLARTNETVAGAHLNQDLPFGRLIEELNPDRDPGRNPLFGVCFTLQHAGEDSARVAGIEAELCGVDVGTARFDLAVQLTPVPGRGMKLWAEYSTELFDAATIRRLFGHYAQALAGFLADPGLRITALPLLTEAEYDAVVRECNRTDRDYRIGGSCLHQLFESMADRDPDAVASRFAGESLSYRDLDERANQLAWELIGAGVHAETVVGVLLDRGPGLPVAFLGAHKAGGAYLPLDPDHPPARWELILGDAGSSLVVTTRALAGSLPDGVRAVCLDDPALAGRPATRPAARSTADNLAYVIFTSGSTGRPKGVQVSHRSIVGFTKAVIELFGLHIGDRVLQFANPAFDVSLFDFFASLCSGATLVQAGRAELLNPDRLTAIMRSEGVTVTDLPPAVLRMLRPEDFPQLRALFVGLEAFPGELVNAWNTPQREFHNGYGPTEATVACVDYRCPHRHYDVMPPIGVPMANYRAYVVDRFGDPVPVGLPGELLIGGIGVARGYAGRPGLTAEKFVPDVFGPAGGRLYRTGDLMRRRPDGNLEFLGRIDNQVKIRGLRIELSEIEHALVKLPGVSEAAVVVTGSGASARLAAYLVTDAGEIDTRALVSRLSSQLPTYLIPSVYTVVPELPRAANGKLDRKRLALPVDTEPAAEPPSTATQIALAEIWSDVLGVPAASVHDGFFDAGGNSLKITQLSTRITEAFGMPLPLRELFVHTTIAQLAELIEERELAALPADELSELLDALDGQGQLR